jgi:hypothetical protein
MIVYALSLLNHLIFFGSLERRRDVGFQWRFRLTGRTELRRISFIRFQVSQIKLSFFPFFNLLSYRLVYLYYPVVPDFR